MSKIGNVNYGYMNWGPFVMKTKLPDYIIKKLKIEGKKAKESYNHQLAGHLDNQFLYSKKTQKWFYDEIQPVIQSYREGHSKFHGINNLNIVCVTPTFLSFITTDFPTVKSHTVEYRKFLIFCIF